MHSDSPSNIKHKLISEYTSHNQLDRTAQSTRLINSLSWAGVILSLFTGIGYAYMEGIYSYWGLNSTVFPQESLPTLFRGVDVVLNSIQGERFGLIVIFLAAYYSLKILWRIFKKWIVIAVYWLGTVFRWTPKNNSNESYETIGLISLSLNHKRLNQHIDYLTSPLKAYQSIILILGLFLLCFKWAYESGVIDAKSGKAINDNRNVSMIREINGRSVHIIGNVIVCSEARCAIAYGYNNLAVVDVTNSDFVLK